VVDGGLTDPVPVSLCRSLGADHVIAVNLNGGIVGKHLKTPRRRAPSEEEQEGIKGLLARLKPGLGQQLQALLEPTADDQRPPGLLDVMATSINIMQDRITRSRMAGDPPDLMIAPELSHFQLMDFHRADEAIRIGEEAVERVADRLDEIIGYLGHGR
jgi:NTE family protein